MWVKIKKISEAPGAPYQAAPWLDYVPGGANHFGKSLPVDYELEGELGSPLIVGAPLVVRRTRRNGVPVRGEFRSSPIVVVESNQVRTENSVYRITPLNRESDVSAGEVG